MRVWRRWLFAVTIGVLVFGLSPLVAPGLTRRFFNLVVYASPDVIDGFGEPAVSYITLVHGVMGAVMFGWGLVFLLILLGPFRRGEKEAWFIFAVSLAAWFIPDTAFSLWLGFWQNAVLNSVFATLFAIPLFATYRHFYIKRVKT